MVREPQLTGENGELQIPATRADKPRQAWVNEVQTEESSGRSALSHKRATSGCGRAIRVLAFMEATSVTGPAKNLIEFAAFARAPKPNTRPVELTIATFQRPEQSVDNLFVSAAKERALTVDVIRERHPFDREIISGLRRVIAAHQPDIIQTHGVKSHFLVRLSGAHQNCRWIAFHHGYTWPDLKMRAYNQLDRWSLPAADQVITVCNAFARDLERLGVNRRQIAVRHNMVKPFIASLPHQISEIRRALGIAPDQLVVVTAGRLSKEKGHIDLLESLSRLKSIPRTGQFRMLIIGDGPEHASIVARVRQLGLSDVVSLVAFQTDLNPYYTLADLLILPSHTEGSPNVLLEAMAAGIPVVATRVGGVTDIASEDVTALLVAKGDPDAMAAAVCRMLENRQLRVRLGKEGQQAAQQYSADAYCSSLKQIYTRLLPMTKGAEASCV